MADECNENYHLGCADEHSGNVWPVGAMAVQRAAAGWAMTADLLQLDVSHHHTHTHRQTDRQTDRQTESERERGKQLQAILYGILPFDISHIQLRFTRHTSRGQVDHMHTHICTHTQHTTTHAHTHHAWPRHRPPPGLTFAAKCCNGWLFMVRGLVMGASSAGGCITLFIRLPQWHYHFMSQHTLFPTLTSVVLAPFSGHAHPWLSLLTAPCVVKCMLTALPSHFISLTDVHQPSGFS